MSLFNNQRYGDMSAKELAALQREQDTWNPEILQALADKAGMSEEWDAIDDGDFVEEVITRIAEKLGVDLW